MQQWLDWPTFLHSSASSSSWEHWRYSICREFSHAWLVTIRHCENGCTQRGSGDGKETKNDLSKSSHSLFPSIRSPFPLTLVLLCIVSVCASVCVVSAWLSSNSADVSAVWIPERGGV